MNDLPSKKKILIVDDARANIDMLKGILKPDYKLGIALDGEQALEAARSSSPPDLILLDIMMPGMDGYEVCRRLKTDEKTRHIPVIFVTGKGQAQDETQGLEVGAVDYITKPVSGPIVLARIRTHLSLRSAYQKLEQQNAALFEAEQLRKDVDHITRHDLKSPLNGIIGFTSLHMNADNLTDDQREDLKVIHDLGIKVVNMVNLSLGLLKMEQGSYELAPKAVDLLPLIRGILADNARTIRFRRVKTAIRVQNCTVREGDRFFVLAEELLCYSLFANLIKNAIEASPPDEMVTIAMEEETDMGTVTIHNRGAVPEEIRDRFFEKYVRSGKKYGTGLGTYSAKLIAEAQGGSTRMVSSQTEGTTLTVRLPKKAAS